MHNKMLHESLKTPESKKVRVHREQKITSSVRAKKYEFSREEKSTSS